MSENTIETLKATTWQEFLEHLKEVQRKRDTIAAKKGMGSPSSLLYRGLANSGWRLDTTLERAFSSPFSLGAYYRKLLKVRPLLETFTGQRWDLVDLSAFTDWLDNTDQYALSGMPGYDFMAYLRHHGFPSPLLDWTNSPYVAAFFAFSGSGQITREAALYCYMEYGRDGKSNFGGSGSYLINKGPYVRSHQRHFLQQSQYTICLENDENRGSLVFSNHHDFFEARVNEPQDYVWRIVSPRTIAGEALRELDKMNINPMSLFGSEDAMVQTLAMREFQ